MFAELTAQLSQNLSPLSLSELIPFLWLFLGGIWVGAQNALAGGGSFVTIPALMAMGLSSLEANITSTVALYPGQVVSGFMGLKSTTPPERSGLATSLIINLAGGAFGGWLLLVTPSDLFKNLLPWLVLSATGIFIWGSIRNHPSTHPAPEHRFITPIAYFLIAIYGGYFGGGIGFLILATLSFSGIPQRRATHVKNALVATINTSAVFVLLGSALLIRPHALALGTGAIFGFLAGSHLIGILNDRYLKIFVILIGLGLTLGLFLKT